VRKERIMNSKTSILCVLLVVASYSVMAQTGLISHQITVSNNAGRSQVLTIGMDPAATNGIDVALGEAQIPPAPPTGVFDARLVGDDLVGVSLGQGTWVDYRQGNQTTIGNREHEIKYQPGGGTTIKIRWNLPSNVTGRIQDIITGTLIDVAMAGTDSFTVTNPSAFSKLKMQVTYDTALPIQLASFTGTVINGNVELRWVTLSEVNNLGFYVQRKRPGDPDFMEIPGSFIPGHGTTNEPHTYIFTDSSPGVGLWLYRLKQVDLSGPVHYSDPIQVDVLTSVEPPNVPPGFSLQQNYPNPFNPETRIRFSIPVGVQHAEPIQRVQLKVYNLLGQEIATLVDEELSAGEHHVTFDASGLTSGVYLYQLRAGGLVQTRKLTVMK
jgi:hypothetical protein